MRYAEGEGNHDYCAEDEDSNTGVLAENACAECGKCQEIAKCPEIPPDFFCTSEFQPVICDDECEYNNDCWAEAAGFNPDNCRIKSGSYSSSKGPASDDESTSLSEDNTVVTAVVGFVVALFLVVVVVVGCCLCKRRRAVQSPPSASAEKGPIDDEEATVVVEGEEQAYPYNPDYREQVNSRSVQATQRSTVPNDRRETAAILTNKDDPESASIIPFASAVMVEPLQNAE
jgi:hypothetical protein